MIETLLNIPPAFILIIGALLLPILPGRLKNWVAILLPALAFIIISQLKVGTIVTQHFFSYDLILVRVDKLSKAFGYIFTLSATVAFIYGYYEKKATEFVSALFYIGSALGVVFAGDLFTLYLYWEIMAIASTFLILARKTSSAMAASKRYIMVHIFGGLVLLAGILVTVNHTGSLAFNSFTEVNIGTWLILIGFLVNAAAIPFSAWLPDAYPESTVMGGVILSAYTSKTAIYTLIRGFPGWDILIAVGCAMAIYGIIYALMENDIRRVLAYSIINQVGFMVCAVGIGSPLAIAGAVAHAFCHIIYKSLLWMSSGAVLHRTGKSKYTDLGGLYQKMPLTLLFGVIGGLSMIAPLTIGFVSKTIILLSTEHQHLFIPWLILEVSSAAVFFVAGIKLPYFVFFNKSKNIKTNEAPKTMLISMAILSVLCIYIGCFPKILYNILPNAEIVMANMPYTFNQIYIEHFSSVVTKLQIILFSCLTFFLFLPIIKQIDTISIDFDWFYRKGSSLFYRGMSWTLNGFNSVAQKNIIDRVINIQLKGFARNAPAHVAITALKPIWALLEVSEEDKKKNKRAILNHIKNGTFPISYSAVVTLLFLAILIYIN
jgi:multicomponent Na+:H+ antiporter subunit D